MEFFSNQSNKKKQKKNVLSLFLEVTGSIPLSEQRLGAFGWSMAFIVLAHIESYVIIPLDFWVAYILSPTSILAKNRLLKVKRAFFRPKKGRNDANVMKYRSVTMTNHGESFLSHNFTWFVMWNFILHLTSRFILKNRLVRVKRSFFRPKQCENGAIVMNTCHSSCTYRIIWQS